MGKPQSRGGSKPKCIKIGRLVRVRKDGTDIKFKDWQGEKKVGRYAPVGALLMTPSTDDRKPLISFAMDENFPGFDREEEFYNLYFEDGVEIDVSNIEPRGGGKSKAKKPTRNEDADDEDEEAPF